MHDSPRMTLTEYAKHRGVTKGAVSQAISKGRLVQSVGRTPEGRPFITDPYMADREWRATTDLTKAPGSVVRREAAREQVVPEAPPAARVESRPSAEAVLAPPPPVHRLPLSPAPGEVLSLADASALEKTWKARLAEMKYREAAGELVRAADVRGKLEGMIHACRTKLLGVPSRARQQDPTMTVPQLEMVESLIREALEELAAGGGL